MEILVIGLILAIALLFVPRIMSRGQADTLKQYRILEKRFGLTDKITMSKWGAGIGERHRLEGAFRGYQITLYSHYHEDDGRRVDWTTLAMETLFAGELELDLSFADTTPEARFPETKWTHVEEIRDGVALSLSENEARTVFDSEILVKRLEALMSDSSPGAIRLGKGFLEYREHGSMSEDATRARFQLALLLLAELADGISLYVTETKKS